VPTSAPHDPKSLSASRHGSDGGSGGVCAVSGCNLGLPVAPVLVVEDEFFVADDLARQIEGDGGAVLGPAANVAEALALLGRAGSVGGAVLDVCLGDETAFSIAEELARRRIPFVFYTARSDIAWPRRFRAAPLVEKPAGWGEIKPLLFRGVHSFRAEVAAQLPELRRIARTFAADAETADRLVERTLDRAADEIAGRHLYASVGEWLAYLLRREAGSGHALN